LRRARYVAGMGEKSTACRALLLKQKEPLRRYRFRWKDNIEMDLKCDDMVWRRYISGSV
jgi:hypothetical protein